MEFGLRNRWGVRIGAVSAESLGSRGACHHLVDKGYLIVDHVQYGPRGGETPFYAPGPVVTGGPSPVAIRQAVSRLQEELNRNAAIISQALDDSTQ
jgi:hypothetical protein